ncbi:MAG TPA: alpha/beta hydrolase [Terriglobia bacterium]|nr:alpha/beta hydrolase [Terriglobia bacterium]
MRVLTASFLIAICLVSMFQGAPEDVKPKLALLWPDGAPGAAGDAEEDRPSLIVYVPPQGKATGTGIVVCPGGGYAGLAMDYEGSQVAEWLNSLGIAAFVLKYRVGPRYHHPAEMEDGQRAVRFVRFHANGYGIVPDHVGIWGFSAGGHLASTIGTHFDNGKPGGDAVDRVSCRPDFMVLAYPVISFTTPYAHKGSMRNLLGDKPDVQLVQSLSNELQVTRQTPPTFLFHTNADDAVPPENSVLFYMALRKNEVPAELHIFAAGRHGVGLAHNHPELAIWSKLLVNWLRTQGFLK